jgi:hypothetical protein
MDNYQASLYVRAMAVCAEIESMKAENYQRNFRGESQAYKEEDFLCKAQELKDIANLIRL